MNIFTTIILYALRTQATTNAESTQLKEKLLGLEVEIRLSEEARRETEQKMMAAVQVTEKHKLNLSAPK